MTPPPAYYTTGQVARICGTSAQTVINWCARELLTATRVGARGRRQIEHEELLRFLKAHNYQKAYADVLAGKFLL